MADLVAADLTYAEFQDPVIDEGSGYRRKYLKITTAAGEYPTGGLPLDKSRMGAPNVIISLLVMEPSAADELQYVYDKSVEKIKVIEDDAITGIPAEHANATFTNPDELLVVVTGW